MTNSRTKLGLAIIFLVSLVVGGAIAVTRAAHELDRVHVVAYFDNSNGVFVGDDVRIKGVRVGRIEAIEPQPTQVRITFWFDAKYPVPADAKAVILSPDTGHVPRHPINPRATLVARRCRTTRPSPGRAPLFRWSSTNSANSSNG